MVEVLLPRSQVPNLPLGSRPSKKPFFRLPPWLRRIAAVFNSALKLQQASLQPAAAFATEPNRPAEVPSTNNHNTSWMDGSLLGSRDGFASIFLARSLTEFDKSNPLAAIRRIRENLATYLEAASGKGRGLSDYASCALGVLVHTAFPEKRFKTRLIPAKHVSYYGGKDLAEISRALAVYLQELSKTDPETSERTKEEAMTTLVELRTSYLQEIVPILPHLQR